VAVAADFTHAITSYIVATFDMVEKEPSAGATKPPAKTCVGKNMGIHKIQLNELVAGANYHF
jgi:hypothetical protein